METLPARVKRTRPDIYSKYIIPIIRQSQPGDELLYVSTTTYFGYYSIGAYMFDTVVAELLTAKEKGVRIRLFVKVHNVFTAEAGGWLLEKFKDLEEIRNLKGETASFYYIMNLDRRSRCAKFVEFSSGIYPAGENVAGHKIRTFDRPLDEPKELDDKATKVKYNQFMHLWEYSYTSLLEAVQTKKREYYLSCSKGCPPVESLPSATLSPSRRVFIGHGRSDQWRVLKDFLADRLGLPCDEFNREAVAGYTTSERLSTMLSEASFAFLVMTAEEEHADSSLHARPNVIHELGLFQGRLGLRRAIVLLEEGCCEFSNIIGLSQIRFPHGDIAARFEGVRRVLEREQII